MMNKRIIVSLSVIAAVAAAVVGGTTAFFSDTETSTGNTFTAGAIDLKVDSQQHYNNAVCVNGKWQLENPAVAPAVNQYPVIGSDCGGTWDETDLTNHKFFNFGDIKPGDSGENTVSLHVVNNDAWVCAAISNLANNDNTLTEPESSADLNGSTTGELQQNLVMTIWRDDGDNIKEDGEQLLYTGPADEGSWALYDSTTGAPLSSGSTGYIGVSWSLPFSTGNEVQTDSLTGDISFSVVQSRNNGSFKCSDTTTNVVNQNDLETESKVSAYLDGSWFFYNDTNDTIMSIDQFSGTGGQNHMEAVAGSEGAKMLLGSETDPRYNIATYKYKNVKLSDIATLKYRVYDTTADSDKPYLHFNVDFDNSDTWQKRLVYVPTGLTTNTWTEVDAIQGGAAMWTYSGATWPTTADPGTSPKTWAQILALYPNAETRSTDSFLGVRVGEPGPTGATGFVDWIQFKSEKTDFDI